MVSDLCPGGLPKHCSGPILETVLGACRASQGRAKRCDKVGNLDAHGNANDTQVWYAAAMTCLDTLGSSALVALYPRGNSRKLQMKLCGAATIQSGSLSADQDGRI